MLDWFLGLLCGWFCLVICIGRNFRFFVGWCLFEEVIDRIEEIIGILELELLSLWVLQFL